MPADLLAMPAWRQVYSLLTLPDGGVLDDLMVLREGPEAFLLVLHAQARIPAPSASGRNCCTVPRGGASGCSVATRSRFARVPCSVTRRAGRWVP